VFRIYRNLHHGLAFSIQHNGRVIDRVENLEAWGCTFKVSENGRQRVLREKCKNVHAFVIAEGYRATKKSVDGLSRVCYDPYKAGHFVVEGQPIHSASKVVFIGGRCYTEKLCTN
jgi:hypothetical protein